MESPPNDNPLRCNLDGAALAELAGAVEQQGGKLTEGQLAVAICNVLADKVLNVFLQVSTDMGKSVKQQISAAVTGLDERVAKLERKL